MTVNVGEVRKLRVISDEKKRFVRVNPAGGDKAVEEVAYVWCECVESVKCDGGVGKGWKSG